MHRVLLFLGLLTVTVARSGAEPDDLPPFNAAILKFCEANEGKRVGSGECTHLADEALRVAGAEFTQTGADGKKIPGSPSEDDYVWGTLVKTYSFDEKAKKVIDSEPNVKCLPGDILQFHEVKTANGFQYPHHTAIVRTVDENGNPTEVYQQNIKLPKGGDARVVQKSRLQTLKMTTGQLMVYRADKPTNPFQMQVSWTNNSNSDTIEFTFGGKKRKIGGPNTGDGYKIAWGGKGVDSIIVGRTIYPLTTRKGYEFYTTPEGQVALREIK